MNKREFTVSDFRQVLKQMVEGDRIYYNHSVSLDTLYTARGMSDEELLKAKLYTDLGMDSLDVWESICIFERDYEVLIGDGIGSALGTGVSVTVQSYLDAINSHQE